MTLREEIMLREGVYVSEFMAIADCLRFLDCVLDKVVDSGEKGISPYVSRGEISSLNPGRGTLPLLGIEVVEAQFLRPSV